MLSEMRGNIMDFWRAGNIIGVTTNGYVAKTGKAVMGRGIAKSIRDDIPGADTALGEHLRIAGNVPAWFDSMGFWTLPVKHNWNEKADIELIERSLTTVFQESRYERLDFVRPGVGNGKLDWNDVKPVVKSVYDKHGTHLDVRVWTF